MIQLPYYEGLSIDEIFDFAKVAENGKAMRALPEDLKERKKMPRAYIANVIYTLIGDPF